MRLWILFAVYILVSVIGLELLYQVCGFGLVVKVAWMLNGVMLASFAAAIRNYNQIEPSE